jgi:hypothetical protein
MKFARLNTSDLRSQFALTLPGRCGEWLRANGHESWRYGWNERSFG